ncbi:hypothetical protein BGZ76_006587 [Entomortierella beljakovae]|nr:hypothetical protein BGZ76_006587 [Entomortierella beljakovae]
MIRSYTIDGRKGRGHVPPPLDTTALFKKTKNQKYTNNDSQTTKTSTPTTAKSSSTAVGTAPSTLAPWKRSRNIAHISTFQNDCSPSPSPLMPPMASSFPLVHPPYSPVFNTINAPTVIQKGDNTTKRSRAKSAEAISSPSPDLDSYQLFTVTFDKIKTSFDKSPHGRSKSTNSSHRYAAILPPPLSNLQHFQELQNKEEFHLDSKTNNKKESQNRGIRIRTMSFRNSPNSASTCVDSPTKTLPATATTAPSDRMADLFTKCQEITHLQKANNIPQNTETSSNADDDCKDGDQSKDNDNNACEEEKDIQDNEFILLGKDQECVSEGNVDVMPWLQEAIKMISVLEAKVVELEEDCQSIPLYEQDREQMIQVIQDLDTIVKLDQTWMENTEKAVRWTSFTLEKALLSASPENLSSKNTKNIRVATPDSTFTTSLCERKSHSEGMLPSLVSENIQQTTVHNESHPCHIPNSHHIPSSHTQQEDLEGTYRNAIMTALRHLKTIERSQSTVSEVIGDNNNDVGTTTSLAENTIKDPLNLSLEKWLENASAGSILSDNCESHSDNKHGQIESSDRNVDPCDSIPSPQPKLAVNLVDEDSVRFEVEVTESTQLQEPSQLVSTKAAPELSASAASFQATISGSSQSLQTNLGGCLMDERVFLKQHIQQLDRLRVQECERHHKTEQAHHQLILDLSRFSKKLLQSVNEFTCAQAAMDEAKELTQMTFKYAECSISDISSVGSPDSITESIKRTKRMIAASSKALAESTGMIEQEIKQMRNLAADCVGIMECAQAQNQIDGFIPNTQEESIQKPADHISITTTPPLPATSLASRIDLLSTSASIVAASQTSLPTLAPSFTIPTPVLSEKLPSAFVDGVAFQEFEGHLASLRSTLGSISKKLLNNSINKRAKSSIASNGALIASSASANKPSSSPLPQLLSSVMSSTIEMTPFMKRVLAEDIYPCLLMHPRTPATRQQGWVSSFLYSSSSTITPATTTTANNGAQTSYLLNQQTPWLQRLLKAIERSTCEVEFWKLSHRHSTTSQKQESATESLATPPRTPSPVDTFAPVASCSLCGIIRPCEFKLRIVDHESSSVTNSKPNVDQQQNHHPLDRFCRDRVVAVCDFYMFLAHLRQGLLDHQSDMELYKKALWLRQRMGCARIGSIDISPRLSIIGNHM